MMGIVSSLALRDPALYRELSHRLDHMRQRGSKPNDRM